MTPQIFYDDATKLIIIQDVFVTIKSGMTRKARAVMQKRADVHRIAHSVTRRVQANELDALSEKIEHIGKVEHRINSGEPELYEIDDELSICLGIVERSHSTYWTCADYNFILCVNREAVDVMAWLSRKVVISTVKIKHS